MKKIFMVILTAIIGIGLVIGDLSRSWAQETEEFTLEEITVTAAKRVENLQKVAMTVQAIQGNELTEMGSTNLAEALNNLAQTTIIKKGRELTISIRGMDDDDMPGNSQSMVVVVTDGTYSNAWGVGYSGLFDMKRVEVLSGPQGTLYGRNAAGGVVNMVSNNPTTEKFEGAGSIEFGNYRLMNTNGMVNAPITDKLAIRTAFQTAFHEGYQSNRTNDNDTKSARVKLGWDPMENMNIIFGFDFNHLGGFGQGDGVIAWETPPEDPWYNWKSKDLFHADRKTTKVYMDLEWSTSLADLTFLPSGIWMIGKDQVAGGYRVGPVEYVAQDHMVDDQHEYQGELRAASKADFFMKWMVGLYLYKWRYNTRGYTTDVTGAPVSPTSGTESGIDGTHRQQDNTSTAIFANATYPITDSFRAVVGGRYTKEKQILEDYNQAPRNPTDPNWQEETYIHKHFDYKLGLEYDLSGNTMLWVDLSTGYKQILRNVQSQTLMSYQIGSKGRYFNQKLQLNATAWYYDYTNFNVDKQRYYYDATGTRQSDQGTGLGDATLYGLDLASDILITQNDRLDLNVSYLHSEVSSLLITWRYYYPPDKLLEGRSLNNSPEWSITSNYQHTFMLNNGAVITPKISVRYETEKTLAFLPNESEWPGYNLDRLNTEPAHHMEDFSCMYGAANGQWNLNAYVKNIENHPEKLGLQRGNMQVGEPRTYGIVLSVQF